MVKNELIAILELLIQNRTAQYTIRELSQERNINYKSAYEVIQKLREEGCVSVQKIGQTCLCQFSQKFTNTVYLAEKARLEKILKDKDLKLVYTELSKVKTQFIALLFGSYARGTQTKHSDFDFLLISHDTAKVNDAISWIPKDIHITHISYVEFVQMLQSKEFSVVSEAVKNNIVFFGIEDYYRFLQND